MISLPNIPTDNLYKFTFVAGLTIILTALIILVTLYNSITNSVDKLEFEVGKTESESAYLIKEETELGIELKAINKKTSNFSSDTSAINQYNINDLKINQLHNKDYREYLGFIFAHKSDLIPYYDELGKLAKTNEILRAKEKQITLNGDIVILKSRQLKSEAERRLVISSLLCIMIFIGGIIAYFGYQKWYLLVQKPSDEKLKLELEELKKKQE